MDNKKLKEELTLATDTESVKKLVDVFNMNIKKKAIVRASKYSELLDGIADQMERRVKETPDQFSNDDLLKYATSLQSVIEKSTNETVANLPTIQLTNIENMSFGDQVDRESLDRIRDTLRAILNAPESTGQVMDVTDYTELNENEEITDEQEN